MGVGAVLSPLLHAEHHFLTPACTVKAHRQAFARRVILNPVPACLLLRLAAVGFLIASRWRCGGEF